MLPRLELGRNIELAATAFVAAAYAILVRLKEVVEYQS